VMAGRPAPVTTPGAWCWRAHLGEGGTASVSPPAALDYAPS
jgi:hypothetical protein